MKILLPVGAMIVFAGSCCCCGLDPEEITKMIEEAQQEATGAGSADDVAAADEGGEATASGDEATASSGGASGSTEGLCGRFKDDGLTVPSGLSVLSCATMGTTEAVVMQGSADPKAACAPIKEWALNKGWSVTTEASMGGTTSIILKNDSKQLTVACTDQTGQTTVSLSISQGY